MAVSINYASSSLGNADLEKQYETTIDLSAKAI